MQKWPGYISLPRMACLGSTYGRLGCFGTARSKFLRLCWAGWRAMGPGEWSLEVWGTAGAMRSTWHYSAKSRSARNVTEDSIPSGFRRLSWFCNRLGDMRSDLVVDDDSIRSAVHSPTAKVSSNRTIAYMSHVQDELYKSERVRSATKPNIGPLNVEVTQADQARKPPHKLLSTRKHENAFQEC
jgi:hypothetical protein